MDAFQQQLLKLAEENEKGKNSKEQQTTSTATTASSSKTSTSVVVPAAASKQDQEPGEATASKDAAAKALGLPTASQMQQEAELEGLCKTLLTYPEKNTITITFAHFCNTKIFVMRKNASQSRPIGDFPLGFCNTRKICHAREISDAKPPKCDCDGVFFLDITQLKKDGLPATEQVGQASTSGSGQ